jgi:Ca2+/Na+ antiporter
MDYFTAYLFLLFVLKIVFIIMALTTIYLKMKGKENSELYKNLFYLKGRVEFVFVILMALLLVYLFNPRKNRLNMINGEVKLLLYLFGIVLLITADWSNFIHESDWFQRTQEILGK